MLICCAATSLAQDIIVFKNGDTLTGKILKQDDVHVYFKSDTVGSVSLRMQTISEIQIEASGVGEIVIPSDAIAPPESAAEVTPQDIAQTPSPSLDVIKEKSAWAGQAGLAIAMREKSYSNDSGIYREEQYQTYRLYGNVNWTGEKNSLGWNWNYRYSADETRIRDDYFNLTQKYNHHLNGGYYAEAKTMYQRDYNRRIDNEFLQTAELGKQWFERPKLQFSTSVGGGYHQYERSVPGETTYISEPKFIFDESLRWQMINSLTLFQKYTHLGDLEKYHFVFSSGLENKLIRNIFLRLEYRLDRDTETTYDDKGYYDKALLTSLFYEF